MSDIPKSPILGELAEVQAWHVDRAECQALETPTEPDRLRPPFRGQIWEDDTDNETFGEFLKCHFHRPILEEGAKSTTRYLGYRHANQIGGTQIAELLQKHRIKHDPGNMVIYDFSDEASNDHMRARFMPMLRSVPDIRTLLEEIQSNNRFDFTTQDILFPGMIFRARAINETTTQRITVRYGMISDARLLRRNGMIQRAFIRSRQYEGREFWVVESFGGEAGHRPEDGCDFHKFMCSTDDRKLWVKCPECAGMVRFTFSHVRASDFEARLPRSTVRDILAKYGCEQFLDEVMADFGTN